MCLLLHKVSIYSIESGTRVDILIFEGVTFGKNSKNWMFGDPELIKKSMFLGRSKFQIGTSLSVDPEISKNTFSSLGVRNA